MPHVLVEVTRVPKGRKGIMYLDGNQDRRLAAVGDRFELRLGSAQALARDGYGKIVGMGTTQKKALERRAERELEQAQDRVSILEQKLAAAKATEAKKAKRAEGEGKATKKK